jgi:hypothetical protein
VTAFKTHLNYLTYLASSRFTRAYAQSRALELEERGNGRWAGMAQALTQAIEAMDAETNDSVQEAASAPGRHVRGSGLHAVCKTPGAGPGSVPQRAVGRDCREHEGRDRASGSCGVDRSEKHKGGSEVLNHIDRLTDMLKRKEAHDQHAQIICGDCQPDSIRAGEAQDAKALRAVLAVVQEVAA